MIVLFEGVYFGFVIVLIIHCHAGRTYLESPYSARPLQFNEHLLRRMQSIELVKIRSKQLFKRVL
jgi:hypothetical protein